MTITGQVYLISIAYCHFFSLKMNFNISDVLCCMKNKLEII